MYAIKFTKLVLSLGAVGSCFDWVSGSGMIVHVRVRSSGCDDLLSDFARPNDRMRLAEYVEAINSADPGALVVDVMQREEGELTFLSSVFLRHDGDVMADILGTQILRPFHTNTWLREEMDELLWSRNDDTTVDAYWSLFGILVMEMASRVHAYPERRTSYARWYEAEQQSRGRKPMFNLHLVDALLESANASGRDLSLAWMNALRHKREKYAKKLPLQDMELEMLENGC